jgi:hypothetical protein
MILFDDIDFFEVSETVEKRLAAARERREIPTRGNMAEIASLVAAMLDHASRKEPAPNKPVDLRLVDAHRERSKLKLIPGGAER